MFCFESQLYVLFTGPTLCHVLPLKLLSQVCFERLADHKFIRLFERGLGLKDSGISSDDSAKSPKLLSHNLQAPQISLFLLNYHWPKSSEVTQYILRGLQIMTSLSVIRKGWV